MNAVAFYVLAVLVVSSALVVVAARRTVVSALALAFNLVTIAGFFFLLEAQFLAVLQVIVYAGAIMVLILFVIMLLNVNEEARLNRSGMFQRVLAPLGGLALVTLLVWGAGRAIAGGRFPEASAGFGGVDHVGHELFTRFFYPFEAISLLLVVAMIGAVLLAKRRL